MARELAKSELPRTVAAAVEALKARLKAQAPEPPAAPFFQEEEGGAVITRGGIRIEPPAKPKPASET